MKAYFCHCWGPFQEVGQGVWMWMSRWSICGGPWSASDICRWEIPISSQGPLDGFHNAVKRICIPLMPPRCPVHRSPRFFLPPVLQFTVNALRGVKEKWMSLAVFCIAAEAEHSITCFYFSLGDSQGLTWHFVGLPWEREDSGTV